MDSQLVFKILDIFLKHSKLDRGSIKVGQILVFVPHLC